MPVTVYVILCFNYISDLLFSSTSIYYRDKTEVRIKTKIRKFNRSTTKQRRHLKKIFFLSLHKQ